MKNKMLKLALALLTGCVLESAHAVGWTPLWLKPSIKEHFPAVKNKEELQTIINRFENSYAQFDEFSVKIVPSRNAQSASVFISGKGNRTYRLAKTVLAGLVALPLGVWSLYKIATASPSFVSHESRKYGLGLLSSASIVWGLKTLYPARPAKGLKKNDFTTFMDRIQKDLRPSCGDSWPNVRHETFRENGVNVTRSHSFTI